MHEGNEDLFMIHASLPQHMSMSIEPTNKVDLDTFKKLMATQVSYLEENRDKLKEIVKTHHEIGHALIQSKISDHLYETHQTEEEDLVHFMKTTPKAMKDPEVQKVMEKLQKALAKTMPMGQGFGGF
eukprot:CAMPEP_0176420502 /NCGR_PEP_ID=MMETSP0127-20121128/8641_1 /TAXON_ID=938130 /ORGANISM="Platyophrya macrostoma, Strain WH" /LENGTH=126 /DNA_ID=CAMNT_0017801103 /DNA_START=470 /DNA_END=850 /DNA_ORIENTATION=-